MMSLMSSRLKKGGKCHSWSICLVPYANLPFSPHLLILPHPPNPNLSNPPQSTKIKKGKRVYSWSLMPSLLNHFSLLLTS